MLGKMKLALNLMRSKTHVVLTDTKAEVLIPLTDLNKIDNILLLSAQAAALKDFKGRLLSLIKEHEDAVDMLANRKDSKLFSKEKTEVTKKGKE